MRSVKCISMGSSSTSLGFVLGIPRKATLAHVMETVVSRCFVGCLRQAHKRCSNYCCCGSRNDASDVRPTDPLAGVESPSQTLAPGVVFCTATAGLRYIFFLNQPSHRGESPLVRHVKCLTFLYMIFDVEKNIARKKSSLFTSKFISRKTLFHI